jgi:hypothetical protein
LTPARAVGPIRADLDARIAERVKQLTEGRQHPVMSRPSTVPDFAFAVAR